VPLGASIVHTMAGKLLVRALNGVRQRCDPSAHAVVRDLGASVAASGFTKLVLYNTHGGNTTLVDVIARDLRAEFGLRTFTHFAPLESLLTA
jgi:creatinine amidohydrolase/Fe(II)-dependent formamide hydrolase-like protein